MLKKINESSYPWTWISTSLFCVLIGLFVLCSIQATMSAERRNICLTNLKQIEAAKQAFAAKSQKTNSYTVLSADIYGPGKGKIDPNRTCPSGGYYIIGTIGGSQYKKGTIDVKTFCSIHGFFDQK